MNVDVTFRGAKYYRIEIVNFKNESNTSNEMCHGNGIKRISMTRELAGAKRIGIQISR